MRTLISWLFLASAALSGLTMANTLNTTAVLDSTEEWHLHNPAGEPYRIMISKPEGDLPYTGGYPVLYVLDGNAYFAALHTAKRAQKAFRNLVIVGIGYPGEQPLNFLRRSYDFSPPAPPDLNTPPQGGDRALLDFLRDQVKPAITQHWPINSHQESLYGHSFAGMFTVFAMLTEPDLFDHYIAASPSLWWQNRYQLEPERTFIEQVKSGHWDVTHTSLNLILAEGDSIAEIEDAQALKQRLQPLSAWGFRSGIYISPGDDHMSVPFSTLNLVLKQATEPRRR